MRSKEYKAFLDIQEFIDKHSFERNRDEMENLGKCLMILYKTIIALEIIREKVPLIYLLAGCVGKYDPEEIEIIKEVYINDKHRN